MTQRPPDEKPILIAGAGTLGMYVLLAALSMLFAASLVLYAFFRANGKANQFPQFHLPATLWLSTLALLASSGTMHWAYKSVQRDDEAALRRGMAATLALAVIFLVLQALNWLELYHQLPPLHAQAGKPYPTLFYNLFYLLTGLHAAHVLGGLIPLSVTTIFTFKGRYSRNFFPGIRYCAIYWHFLDVIWLILFTVIYIIG